ncbi:MAG TPA: hypothetical protein VGL93_30335 [Streptosporangiaceae bacterium]|jgi:hypothetical protein
MDDRTRAFMNTHARLLDRRRYEHLAAPSDRTRDAVRAALAAYLIPGGGYGAGLEPDLRSGTAQPVAGLHAFEVFEEVAPHPVPEAAALCDWLAAITLPDGGLPFALPVPDTAGVAPFFAAADPAESSPHMTAMLAGCAHRLAGHDPAVRDHPWLAAATAYTMDRVRAMDGPGHALEYRFALQFLDAAHDRVPDAPGELRRLGAFLPPSGILPVAGGIEGESMRPLDFAPAPDRPIRALFPPGSVDAELDRLAADRHDDGGWDVDWAAFSPAATLEWRGWATVRAVQLLRAAHRDPAMR